MMGKGLVKMKILKEVFGNLISSHTSKIIQVCRTLEVLGTNPRLILEWFNLAKEVDGSKLEQFLELE